MYESPVQLRFNKIQTELIKRENEMLIRAVQEVVPNVTEEELVKALRYDRGQYEKGFWDGREARDAEILRCKECKWFGKVGCPICVVDESDEPKETDFCSFGERREDG